MVRRNDNDDWQQESPIPRARPVDPVPATPDEQALLERVAAIRAEGATWDQTGEKLKRPAAELEALARAHPLLFRRLMSRADREMAREDRRVARIVFRRQMRKDPESQAARLSAQCLVGIDLTYYRHRNKKPRFYGLDPNDPKVQEAIREIERQRLWTDEQKEEIVADAVERGFVKVLVKRHPEWFPQLRQGPETDELGGNPVPRDPTPPTDSAGARRQRPRSMGPIGPMSLMSPISPMRFMTLSAQPIAPRPRAR